MLATVCRKRNKQFVSNRKHRFALDIFKLFQKTNDREIDYPMSCSYFVSEQWIKSNVL